MPTITFNVNGGTSGPAPQTVAAGSTFDVSTVSATWAVDVTFNANGGTFYQEASTHVETFSVTTDEWAYTAQDADDGDNISAPITVNDDIILYASWFGNQPKLTSLPIESNTSGNIVPRDDYRIDPEYLWTFTQNSTDTISIPYVLTQDIALYARWQYRILFDLAGGYSLEGPPYYVSATVTGTSSLTITDAVEDHIIMNTTVDMDYSVSGYTGATITISDGANSQTYTISFGRTIYGGSINFYTGQLVDAYESDGTPKDPWDTYTLTPVPIYTLDTGVTTLTVTSSVGVIGNLEYYTDHVNIWNEEWEVGAYTNTGGKVDDNNEIRSKYHFPVKPNTSYYFHCGFGTLSMRYCYYNSSDTFISYVIQNTNTVVTTPNNAAYVAFNLGTSYGGSYRNDCSLNYPSTDTTYLASKDIIADSGPVTKWKTHGVTFSSPYTTTNLNREGYNLLGFSTTSGSSTADLTVNFTYSTDAPLHVYSVWQAKVWTVKFYDGYSPAGQDFLKQVNVVNGSDVPVAEIPVVGQTYQGRVFRNPGNYSLLGWSGPYDYTLGTLTNITSDINSSAMWDFAPIWIRVMEGGVAKWVSYKPVES